MVFLLDHTLKRFPHQYLMFFIINYRPLNNLIVSLVVEFESQIVHCNFATYHTQLNQEAVNRQQSIYLQVALTRLAQHHRVIANRVNFLNHEIPRMTKAHFF